MRRLGECNNPLGRSTPERRDPGGPKAPAARRALTAGGTVRLKFADSEGKKRDNFGRLLCRVYVADVDVGDTLLRQGHAREWEP